MITEFKDNYKFLSNFYEKEITINNLTYGSSEAAFQSFKTTDPEIRKSFCSMKPWEAKKTGKVISLRSDWDKIKLEVMGKVCWVKFKDPELRQLLLNTGDEWLVEGNLWQDTFWGICNGHGRNELGKILMKIRDRIRKEE